MMRARVLIGLVLCGAAASGCVVQGSGYVSTTTPVVYREPPPPQVEQVRQRPAHIWVKGRWDWRSGQWTWMPGHFERAKPNHRWRPGRWELQGNYYVWIEGRWDAER